MGRTGGCSAFFKALILSCLLHSAAASALSWRNWPGVQPSKTVQPAANDLTDPENAAERHAQISISGSASQLLRRGGYTPNSYDLALDELAKLESEPLCHRIAARLLVNNCQLLEGKDEATVLTDSGRKVRDFVDSYAASLAICDLERGRFQIPTECTKFREPTLSQLPLLDAAHLHVTSGEIDACLSGLGASDSAWNTWVSYRHKALRFCEAARVDNDKDQHIILFRRLTKIMSKLADEVDGKLEERMNDLDVRAQAVGDKIDNLSPLISKLHSGLGDADAMLSDHLIQSIRTSQDHLDSGLKSAGHLEKLLEMLLGHITESHAEMENAQEQSLQLVTQKAKSEVEVVVNTMAAAVAATMALQNQVEVFYQQTVDLEYRQDILGKGMERLVNLSDRLTGEYDGHAKLLQQANNITDEVLHKLGDTAASATTLNDALRQQGPSESWWPYIWCPVVSLVMGSYGLPPSLLRNMGLILLGETAGLIISSFSSLSLDSVGFTTVFTTSHIKTANDHNITTLPSESELR